MVFSPLQIEVVHNLKLKFYLEKRESKYEYVYINEGEERFFGN